MLSEIGWALVIWVTLPVLLFILPAIKKDFRRAARFATAMFWVWLWGVVGIVVYALAKLINPGLELYKVLTYVLAAGLFSTMIAAAVYREAYREQVKKMEGPKV